MIGWIGGNSRGNITFGLATRLGGGEGWPQSGCISWGCGVAAILVASLAIGGLLWLLGSFLVGVFSGS